MCGNYLNPSSRRKALLQSIEDEEQPFKGQRSGLLQFQKCKRELVAYVVALEDVDISQRPDL